MQYIYILFQFKVAYVTAEVLWILGVQMKVLMRMNESQTYVISFLNFLCLWSLLWWEHHLLPCQASHPVATLMSSEPVLLSHRSLLPLWPVKNQRFN